MDKVIRIGCGAGFSGDRMEPAVVLAEKANLDYLVLECLAERTIALAQKQKLSHPNLGFDPFLERRIQSLLPHLSSKNIVLITNMGAANPIQAAHLVKELVEEFGLKLKVAAVFGDDVLDQLSGMERTIETGKAVQESGELISANAYLGVGGILEALEAGAQIIITGRVADPSLFLAPLMYEFGWEKDDLLGKGTVIGHLLECAGHLTGGYYMDANRKKVENPAQLGHPFAEVRSDGTAIFTKVEGTGGVLNLDTVKEQLLYEVINPHAYLTPDVSADFTQVHLSQLAKDIVEVQGGSGRPAPAQLKVSVGYRAFFLGEGEISYAGHDACERAQLAAEILKERLGNRIKEMQIDLIGQNSIIKNMGNEIPMEVRLRCAAKCNDMETAQWVGEEVEALYTNGPAGGGGVRKYHKEVIGIHSILMDRNLVKAKILILE